MSLLFITINFCCIFEFLKPPLITTPNFLSESVKLVLKLGDFLGDKSGVMVEQVSDQLR